MNWEGKKVLVTGACGFIGSHLVEYLVGKGAEVRVFEHYNSFGSWGWLETLDEEITKVIDNFAGDIKEESAVRKAVKDIDLIFNLAALIAIPYSYISPSSYLHTNVEGTVNILRSALDSIVSKIIQMSSSEVYGTAKYIPIDEKHQFQAQSPYAASKIAADAFCYSFFTSYGLPVVIARPFNTFGPRQSARAVIPTIITQILSGRDVVKLGSSKPTRDFTYVKDTVVGLCKLAESDLAIGKAVNIGNKKTISMGELASMIGDLCNRDVEFEFDDIERMRPKTSEVYQLLCDNSLLYEITKWKPHTTLEVGIKETIEWFNKNLSYYKSDIYNV